MILMFLVWGAWALYIYYDYRKDVKKLEEFSRNLELQRARYLKEKLEDEYKKKKASEELDSEIE